jgi:hypothetical protein
MWTAEKTDATALESGISENSCLFLLICRAVAIVPTRIRG